MTEIHKIDGAPGTGKSTMLFDSIRERAANGCSVDDIFVVTFTRSGRTDGIEELLGVFPELSKKDAKKRVRTFHGAALKTCKDAGIIIEIDDQLIVQESTPEVYGQFCHEQMLSYLPEQSPDWDQLRNGAPRDTPVGNRIFAIDDWLTLTQRPPEDHPRAPVGTALDYERVVDILNAWEAFKQAGVEIMLDGGEVMTVPYFEHADYVDAAIDAGLVPHGRFLYVDEFQDLSPQEYRLFKTWRDSGEYEEIMLAGDPEQCIPKGTPVQTPDGPVPIEEVSEGDEVVSAYTGGKAKPFEVTATHERLADEPIVSLTTESGATVSCTRNHELFAVLPHQPQSNGDVGDRYFVYVMKSPQGDYRVGITKQPRQRFNAERFKTAMMIVSAHEAVDEALIEEKKIAYKYGIPQSPFKERGGLSQQGLDELYDSLDTQRAFYELCEDNGLDPERFHLVTQSMDPISSESRMAGEHTRVTLTLGLVRERKNGSDYVYHKAGVETSNADAIERLRQTTLNESDGTIDGAVRFRLHSSDYMKVREAAREAVEALRQIGICAEFYEKTCYGSFDESCGRRVPLSVVPASQVTEGMYVPVVTDGSVEYEQVVARTEQDEMTMVYDLTVPPTHNYVIGTERGVAVHNSIYRFREATPYFFEETPVDNVTLRKASYRVPECIAAVARGVLADCPATDPRGFRAKQSGGTVRSVNLRTNGDLRTAVSNAIVKHAERDHSGTEPAVFLLARANHHVEAIEAALQADGIPYRQLGKKTQTWGADVTKLYNALWAIQDDRHATVGSVKKLVTCLPDGEERARQLFGGRPMWGETKATDLFSPDDLRTAFSETPLAIANALTNLTGDQRTLLTHAFERIGGATHHPTDHCIGTIHSAKGLEARGVFLFDTLTSRIEDAYYKTPANAAEEHRIFYVGVTRASESLYVVRDYLNGPVFPGFRGQIPTTQPPKDLEDTGGETA